MKSNYKISIIVIAKNEAAIINKCLNSIEIAINKDEINQYEVIVVDSNSTDDTLKKIRSFKGKFPLEIVRIVHSTRYSAALARRLGSYQSHSNTDYLLFLDGDMELNPDFIVASLAKLEKERNFVGSIGIRNDISISNNKITKNFYNVGVERKAPHFGGAIFLEKNALFDVGNYNKLFFSNEEPDLYLRLLKNDLFILELPIEMINHYEKKMLKTKIINFIKSDRLCGVGQTFINSLKENYFLTGIKHQATRFNYVSISSDIISVLLAIFSIIELRIFILLIFSLQTILVLYAIYKFSFKKYLIGKLYFLGTIKTLFKKRDISYCTEIETYT